MTHPDHRTKNAEGIDPPRPESLGRTRPHLFDPQSVELRERYPERRDDWFTTHSGRQFFLLSPTPESIAIEDIAHALSMICRWGGHTKKFYSVAQHSVHVSYLLTPDLALQGLLHDATEAYVGDVVRPLKVLLADYDAIEALVWEAIAAKFNLPVVLDPAVKRADLLALAIERRDLVTKTAKRHIALRHEPVPNGQPIVPVGHSQARDLFLKRFKTLTQGL